MKIQDVSYYPTLKDHLKRIVAFAIEEDVGDGDITAQLIPAGQTAEATIITKQDAVVCGQAWVEEVFIQIDPSVTLEWHVEDGDPVTDQQVLVKIHGNARSILTAERCALNFLQTLSGTATAAAEYAKTAKGTNLTILDTRKTVPGLRLAQKYAVKVGGCENHRLGLYDMFLIKENHIAAAGGISQVVEKCAEIAPDSKIMVEVETLEEFQEASKANIDFIMLDEFADGQIIQAIEMSPTQSLEISGGLELDSIQQKRFSKPVRASVGVMTKRVLAVDLSLRVGELTN